MKGRIYKISTTESKKVYIGQTIKPLDERFRGHIISSNNGGDTHLYRAFKKYGIHTFSINMVEDNIIIHQNLNETQNSLDLKEIYWVKYYDSFNCGYNMNMGGNGTLGMEHSDYSKKLISEKNTGKKRTDEMKLARTGDKNHMTGKKHSEETKKKMSDWHKGKTVSEETREKLRNNRLGKKHSEESKKKISESTKGRVVSDETKERARITRERNGPLVHSDETKKKMSDAKKESRKNNLNYFNTYEIYNSNNELLHTIIDGLKKFLVENKFPVALMDTYRKNVKLYSSNSGLKRAETLGYTKYIGWYIIKKDK